MTALPPTPAIPKAPPRWLQAIRAGAAREREHLRGEIAQIRGGLALLMKQRNGGRWDAAERHELRATLRSLTQVSPYLIVLALPGSVLLLPLLAWHLDSRRQRRLPEPGLPGKSAAK